jgi:putative addiction module component (TIGR02574 family)
VPALAGAGETTNVALRRFGLSQWISSPVGCTVTIRGNEKMDTTEEIVEAFRRLPADERARLVEELWDEVAREFEQRPLSDAERRLLDERLRQHDDTPSDVETWEKARDDIVRDL